VENSLKQRIIGAIVLVALAIIFLPAILKEKASNGKFESKIPDKPKVLEEYRVDKDKIEKLNRQHRDQHQQQIAKPSESQTQDEAINQASVSPDSNNDNEQAAEPLVAQTSTGNASPTKDKQSSRKSKSRTPSKQINQPNGANNKLAGQAVGNSLEKDAAQTLNPKFKSAAWVVQVASFSNQDNAVKLVEKLKEHQFKAYRRRVEAAGKTVYRVYVGPYIDKSKAQQASTSISRVSETQVVLRVFDPVKH
jgi:DedD protein